MPSLGVVGALVVVVVVEAGEAGVSAFVADKHMNQQQTTTTSKYLLLQSRFNVPAPPALRCIDRAFEWKY